MSSGYTVGTNHPRKNKSTMNTFQIDAEWFTRSIRGLIDVEPVVDYDTKQQKTDKNNLPKWKLQLLWKTPEMGTKKPLVVEVGFATDEVIQVEPGMTPTFHNLVGRHWENQNTYGYSSGVSMSADRIDFNTTNAKAPKPKPAAEAA